MGLLSYEREPEAVIDFPALPRDTICLSFHTQNIKEDSVLTHVLDTNEACIREINCLNYLQRFTCR